jgi:hypothetical protein
VDDFYRNTQAVFRRREDHRQCFVNGCHEGFDALRRREICFAHPLAKPLLSFFNAVERAASAPDAVRLVRALAAGKEAETNGDRGGVGELAVDGPRVFLCLDAGVGAALLDGVPETRFKRRGLLVYVSTFLLAIPIMQ